jgi:hypothetical protein
MLLRYVGGTPMFTSAECRAMSEQKLAQAEHDDRHRNRLITAAQGWLLLASQIRRLEAANGVVIDGRSRRSTNGNGANKK